MRIQPIPEPHRHESRKEKRAGQQRLHSWRGPDRATGGITAYDAIWYLYRPRLP